MVYTSILYAYYSKSVRESKTTCTQNNVNAIKNEELKKL